MNLSDNDIKRKIREILVLHQSQKDEDAVYILDELIQLLNSTSPIVEGLFSQTIDLKVFYLLAGDIYTNVGDDQKALTAYKRYHYWLQQVTPHTSMVKKNCVVVYSYRSYGEYFLEDLINKTITCSSPSVMNDPFDSVLSFWSKQKNLDSLTKMRNNSRAYSKSCDYYRIRSFVANRETYDTDDTLLNNIRMWSFYADDHKGLCVKYRLSKRFISPSKPWDNLEEDNFSYNILRIYPVTYTDDYSLKDLKTVDSTKMVCMKHSSWKDEKEVRLISYNTNCEEKWYAEPLRYSQIEEIIFGYRCTNEHKSTIYKLANALYGNIQFYEMYINEKNSLYTMMKKEYIPDL